MRSQGCGTQEHRHEEQLPRYNCDSPFVVPFALLFLFHSRQTRRRLAFSFFSYVFGIPNFVASFSDQWLAIDHRWFRNYVRGFGEQAFDRTRRFYGIKFRTTFFSLIFPDGILSVPFPHFHGTSFFNGPFPALIKFRGRSPPFARVPRIFRTRSTKRCAMMDIEFRWWNWLPRILKRIACVNIFIADFNGIQRFTIIRVRDNLFTFCFTCDSWIRNRW